MRGGRTILSVESWIHQNSGLGAFSPGAGQEWWRTGNSGPTNREPPESRPWGRFLGGTDRIVPPPLNLPGLSVLRASTPAAKSEWRGGRCADKPARDRARRAVNGRMRGGRTILSVKSWIHQNAGLGDVFSGGRTGLSVLH